MKIKKGDTIIVMTGKDLGKKGKVEHTFPKKQMVLVTGINVYKRHLKKRDEKNPGGIVDIVKPINIAKVALVCPSCAKPTRIRYLVTKGDKERICLKCEKKI